MPSPSSPKPRQRFMEIPTDPWSVPERRNLRPETELQALMEAAPHQVPLVSNEEKRAITEVVRDAFEALPEEERMLLEAVVFERASFRTLERRWCVSKTTLHRWYAAALLTLRVELIEHPEIVKYLDRNEPLEDL